ncbi:MAG: thermonuclease family protein [Chloroflexi bacterium]|nr:thermonuclease family protein [Chloroflexota bacterium]
MNKLLTTLFFLLSLSVQAETLEGKVVKIADGDTLSLLTSPSRQVKVRLAGIDAPEKAQPFGNKAKKALAALTFQKQASVAVETEDRYGRTVGRVMVGGLDVNAELVRQGMAWVYRKYTSDQKLYALEVEAKLAKRGLWSSQHPIEPWLWRRGKRGVEHNPSVVAGMIVANKRSHVYHLPECPSYSMVSEKNRVLFPVEALAVNNGYRKAGNCP